MSKKAKAPRASGRYPFTTKQPAGERCAIQLEEVLGDRKLCHRYHTHEYVARRAAAAALVYDSAQQCCPTVSGLCAHVHDPHPCTLCHVYSFSSEPNQGHRSV
jgi:hypothetical protein